MVVRGRANVPLGVGAPSEAALAPSRRDLIGRTGPVSMEWGYACLEGPVAMEWGRSGGNLRWSVWWSDADGERASSRVAREE